MKYIYIQWYGRVPAATLEPCFPTSVTFLSRTYDEGGSYLRGSRLRRSTKDLTATLRRLSNSNVLSVSNKLQAVLLNAEEDVILLTNSVPVVC